MHFLGPVFLLLLQPAFSAFVAASDFHQLLSEKCAQPLPTASTLAQGSSEERGGDEFGFETVCSICT